MSNFTAADLKARKEKFVTGLTGGTIHDIYLVTSISLVAYFSYCLLNTFTPIFVNNVKKTYNLNPFTAVLDYLLNWLALLLSITTYSDHIILLIYGILIPVATLTTANFSYKSGSEKTKTESAVSKGGIESNINVENISKQSFLPKRPYLTVYRSQMLIITAIAILAVDFHIFPRRFAKCETWGTSLMDLGVGSFVFSMGIVSARQSIWSKFNQRNLSFIGKMVVLVKKTIKSVQGSFTVFLLGVGRLVLVKLLDYQEHVSEYGVHWNFFVTLSLLQPVKYIMEFVFSLLHLNSFNVVIGLTISLAYEYLLQKNNGQYLQYLLSDEHSTIFDKNKEGITSLIGYVSIFLIGESVGSFLLPGIVTPFNVLKNSSKSEIQHYYKHTSKQAGPSLYNWLRSKLSLSADSCLVTYTILFDVLGYYAYCSPYFTPVSRRFANLQYVLFVAAYNLNYLTGFKLISELFSYFSAKKENTSKDQDDSKKYSQVPYSLESINNNGLLVFLVSNVLTGLINMSINTLDASVPVSLIVLIAYTLTVNTIAAILHYFRIYIKL